MEKEIKMLVDAGCEGVEAYALCNNHGYKFTKGGVKYDLRYWANCYGVYGGGWALDSISRLHRSPSFGDDFEKVIDWIKLYT